MSEAKHIPNHTTDPKTGFIECNAYLSAFNGERKEFFIKHLISNGLSLYKTCEELGLSIHTVNKHYRIDPAFKEALDEARRDYADRLDGISKVNATNPKSVIERIFQLKSLFPERYADQKSQGTPQITINIDGKLVEMAKRRQEMLEATPINSTPVLPTESTSLSDSKEKETNNMRPSVE